MSLQVTGTDKTLALNVQDQGIDITRYIDMRSDLVGTMSEVTRTFTVFVTEKGIEIISRQKVDTSVGDSRTGYISDIFKYDHQYKLWYIWRTELPIYKKINFPRRSRTGTLIGMEWQSMYLGRTYGWTTEKDTIIQAYWTYKDQIGTDVYGYGQYLSWYLDLARMIQTSRHQSLRLLMGTNSLNTVHYFSPKTKWCIEYFGAGAVDRKW